MTWFLKTHVGRWLAVIGAAITALASAVLMGRRDGRKDASRKAKDEDHESATNIRDAVRHRLDDELRKHDSAGWRD